MHVRGTTHRRRQRQHYPQQPETEACSLPRELHKYCSIDIDVDGALLFRIMSGFDEISSLHLLEGRLVSQHAMFRTSPKSSLLMALGFHSGPSWVDIISRHPLFLFMSGGLHSKTSSPYSLTHPLS